MNGHPRRLLCRPSLGSLAAPAMVLLVASSVPTLCAGSKDSMAFAADMAERGNWREARFRWEQLLAADALDVKVLNNLAVAAEAVGDGKSAAENYSRALELAGDEPSILDNFRRFERLREYMKPDDATADGVDESSDSAAAPDPTSTPAKPSEGGKIKGKAQRVNVAVPIPPRIKLEGLDTLLVASFRADDSALLDINRELTRFLRGEFRQRTRLAVLDVVPPPAIPEQRMEDLIKNHEFWKHLGREYEADLIVSGIVQFSRQEVSGFEEVDLISPTTGQKVRETRFVEQEEFNYGLDLLYMDGKTGAMLFRDRLRRSVRFRGLMNDPLHAFYELSESLSDDIVAVVSTRTRVELRTIYKR